MNTEPIKLNIINVIESVVMEESEIKCVFPSILSRPAEDPD